MGVGGKMVVGWIPSGPWVGSGFIVPTPAAVYSDGPVQQDSARVHALGFGSVGIYSTAEGMRGVLQISASVLPSV